MEVILVEIKCDRDYALSKINLSNKHEVVKYCDSQISVQVDQFEVDQFEKIILW